MPPAGGTKFAASPEQPRPPSRGPHPALDCRGPRGRLQRSALAGLDCAQVDLAVGLRVAPARGWARCTGFRAAPGRTCSSRRATCPALQGQLPGEVGAPPPGPDARHAGNCTSSSAASRKPQGSCLGRQGRRPQGTDRMAEGKAGGAAGLFAKQMQKKFSRAQEKVSGGLHSGGGWMWREGCTGCPGVPEVWAEEKGVRLPLGNGSGEWSMKTSRLERQGEHHPVLGEYERSGGDTSLSQEP